MATEHEANVRFGGEASGAQAAAAKAKAGVDEVSNATKRATASTDAFTKTNEKLTTTMAAASKATKQNSMSLDQMRSQVMASMEVMTKAVKAIDAITEAEIAAGGGADIFTQSWISLKKTLNDPAFFQRVKSGLADIFTAMDPFQQMAAQIGKGFGDHRRGVGFRAAGATVRQLAGQVEATNLRDQANLTAGLLGSLMVVDRVRKEHLKTERGITQELKSQVAWANEIAMRADQVRVGDMQRRAAGLPFAEELHAVRLAEPGMRRDFLTDEQLAVRDATARSQFGDTMRGLDGAAANEGPFGAFDASPEVARIEAEKTARQDFIDFQIEATQSEVERIGLLEERKQVAHDAAMAQLMAEQQATQVLTSSLADAAGKTIGALVSIGDARRNATRMAKMQGATDREAARAGEVAALQQKAAILRQVRDIAIAKAPFEVAEGIAAFARYDFAAGAQHMAAAAAYTAAAIGTGLGANAIEARADSMQGSGGFGGGGTSSSRGSTSPRSGAAPIDSPIPGSPSPQAPTAGGRSSGASRVNDFRGATFQFYGAGGRKQFVEDLDRDLADLTENGRRAS